MLRVIAIAFALVIGSNLVIAQEAKVHEAKNKRSFEECQKRAQAHGTKWMGTNGRHFSNPTNPNAKGFIAQCMRGEV